MKHCKGCSHPTICNSHGCGVDEARANTARKAKADEANAEQVAFRPSAMTRSSTNPLAVRTALDLFVTKVTAAERERCYELAAEEQLYPNDADCSAVNGVVQRLMTRIENGTTIDDLRSNAVVIGAAGIQSTES